VASEALSFLAFFAFLAGYSEAPSKYSASDTGFLLVFLRLATLTFHPYIVSGMSSNLISSPLLYR